MLDRTLSPPLDDRAGAGDFDLDLQTAEEYLSEDDAKSDVVLGVPDGSTPPEGWVRSAVRGSVLFLAVEGGPNKLASDFARGIRSMGGQLMHFRKFLVASPPGANINTDGL